MLTVTPARYTSLDAWRGIACLSVVAFHAAYLASVSAIGDRSLLARVLHQTYWLQHGVSIFFVISGYCIAATVASSHRRQHGLASYFARRFRRIFPPYWIAVGLTGLLMATAWTRGFDSIYTTPWAYAGSDSDVPLPWTLNAWQWAGNLTLTEGWRFHLTPHWEREWFLGTAWTLAYEEQFYVVSGMLLALSRRRSFEWFYRGSAAITALTVLLLAVRPLAPTIAGFFFDGMWLMFALGIAVFRYVQRGDRTMWIWMLAALAGAVSFTDHRLLAASTFALALVILHRWDGPISDSRWLAPLRISGQMCYSMYLVHWPIAKGMAVFLFNRGLGSPAATLLVTVPLVVMMSAIVGWTFHLAVERRFLNTASAPEPAPSATLSPA